MAKKYTVVNIPAGATDYELYFSGGNFLTTDKNIFVKLENNTNDSFLLKAGEVLQADFHYVYITTTVDTQVIVGSGSFKLLPQAILDGVNIGGGTIDSVGTVNTVNNVERTNSISFNKLTVGETGTLINIPAGAKKVILTNTGSNVIYLSSDGSINGYVLQVGATVELEHIENVNFYAVCDATLASELSTIIEG